MAVTNTFAPNTTIKSSEVNANFTYITNYFDNNSGDALLKPAANGDVVVFQKFMRDNSGTAGYVDSYIQSGWGYIEGNGTTSINKNVTFPRTFASSAVRVVASYIGVNATSAPTSEGNLPDSFGSGPVAAVQQISSSGFAIILRSVSATTMDATDYFGFAWIAVGPI